MQQISNITVKLPKPVFLHEPSDFTKFEENLKTLCEKFIAPDWDWTFKVGGKVQRELEEKDPQNGCLKKIREEDGENTHVYKQEEEEGENENEGDREEKKEKKTNPPHPPLPPKVLSKGALEVMGKRGWEVKKLRETEEDRFFKMNKEEFESKKLLSVRKEIWEWAVLCVQGEKKTLFCQHLVGDIDKWDIYQLYLSVKKFLHTENYRDVGMKMEKFFTARPNQGEDIFSYINRLEKYKEEIQHLEYLAREIGETLVLPKFCVVWKILSALEIYPEYKIFLEEMQTLQPNKWIQVEVSFIREELHKIHSNKVVMKQESKTVVGFNIQQKNTKKVPPPPPPTQKNEWSSVGRGGKLVRDNSGPRQGHSQSRFSQSPRKYPVQQQLTHFKCPEKECLGYFRFGKCPRKEKGKECSFLHSERERLETKTSDRRSTSTSPVRLHTQHNSFSPQRSNTPYSRSTSLPHSGYQSGGVKNGGVSVGGVCGKCGNNHGGVCMWNKRCFVCGGLHSARVCRKTQTVVVGGQERRKSF
jgi:hypothetical protein